ncbi:helix-turn-helix domain-containing protein [Sutcliffiella horikoshii]|uniref:helix-turn-helix transcriptional regulator n=1 Tax=Sutcliffiella horikoshii TaxID=79883 RepID=UPI00203DA35C|nr:helix-turn-helix domain-containing protein [Sutcliffiella horikoshii]MCM3618763.1 helix-turn-helix domain-containing protein [Sutcliffiella horikoshii]
MPIRGFTCNLRLLFAEEKMKNASFTQTKFANKIGLSSTALSALVTERSLPSFEVAYAIAKELNKSIEQIWVK